jgi:hypothetical protein
MGQSEPVARMSGAPDAFGATRWLMRATNGIVSVPV